MKTPLILTFLILIACQNSKKKEKANDNSQLNPVDNNSITVQYQNLAELLELNDISKGVDSFELRLWSSLVITDLKTVTILSYKKRKWELTQTRYWVSKGLNSLIKFDSSSTYQIIPRISFSKIYDSIKAFHLENLPNQINIPNFTNRIADGYSYFIEIAHKDLYHTIWYNNPDYYSDRYNKIVASFLGFLNRQHLSVNF